MDEHEVKEAQINRINAFLVHHNASFDTLSNGRQKQFLQADSAIQKRLQIITEAKETLKTYGINVSSIATETGIARKTFYNNELLRMFVESYSVDDEKIASAAELSAAKERISEVEQQLQAVFDRDIETGKLWHENESLQKEIKNMRVQIQNLQQKYEEVCIDNDRLRQSVCNNVIEIGSFRKAAEVSPMPVKKRVGTNPNTFNLGISYGSTLDFNGALDVAAKCGTRTLMLYCDNEYFETPTASALRGYKIVIHGPLNINLANPDPRIRKTSVQRVIAIIKKCNTFRQYISSFVLHPGSADDMTYLIESLKEILPVAKFSVAIEIMSGKGKELCSTIEQLADLYKAMSVYSAFSICLDTCHISDAGYDLADSDNFIKQLLSSIPVNAISCIHVNDSLNGVGSHKDRHAVIGTGKISLDSLAKITTFEGFYDIPKIIESPQNDDEDLTFKDEMKRLLVAAQKGS